MTDNKPTPKPSKPSPEPGTPMRKAPYAPKPAEPSKNPGTWFPLSEPD